MITIGTPTIALMRTIPVLVLLALIVASCGGGVDLEGTGWELSEATGVETVPGTTAMTFGVSEVSGSTGCNQFAGSYETNGDSITFGPMAITRAACADAALTEQEMAMMAAFDLATNYAVSEGVLEFLDSDGAVVATYTEGNSDLLGG